MDKPTMLDYVLETPHVLRAQLASSPASSLADIFCADAYERMRIVASGSSRNAALIARPYLRSMLGREVLVTEPYTFCSYECELPANELCFAISQSGYSTNTLEALAAMRGSGRLAIGITGDVSSDFKDAADVLIDYGVGEEQVGYVTKGVSALVLFLQLLGLEIAYREGRLDKRARKAELSHLAEMVGQFETATVQARETIEGRYKELSAMERVFFAGASANYGVGCEGALKFGECIQIPAMAFELDEYLHGPNLQLSPEYTVFVNAVGGGDHERARQIVAATRLVTDHVFVLTDDSRITDADILIEPAGPVLARPACLLPFYQICAYRITEDRHLWHKHPLVARFDAALSGKSENYVDKEVL